VRKGRRKEGIRREEERKKSEGRKGERGRQKNCGYCLIF
jgi:hypothetical protein